MNFVKIWNSGKLLWKTNHSTAEGWVNGCWGGGGLREGESADAGERWLRRQMNYCYLGRLICSLQPKWEACRSFAWQLTACVSILICWIEVSTVLVWIIVVYIYNLLLCRPKNNSLDICKLIGWSHQVLHLLAFCFHSCLFCKVEGALQEYEMRLFAFEQR